MTTRAQEAALEQIKDLERIITNSPKKIIPKHTTDSGFGDDISARPIEMSVVQKGMEKYLKKVEGLVKDCELQNDVYSRFRSRVIDAIYRAGMKRRDFAWATEFARKYKI